MLLTKLNDSPHQTIPADYRRTCRRTDSCWSLFLYRPSETPFTLDTLRARHAIHATTSRYMPLVDYSRILRFATGLGHFSVRSCRNCQRLRTSSIEVAADGDMRLAARLVPYLSDQVRDVLVLRVLLLGLGSTGRGEETRHNATGGIINSAQCNRTTHAVSQDTFTHALELATICFLNWKQASLAEPCFLHRYSPFLLTAVQASRTAMISILSWQDPYDFEQLECRDKY